jgi:fatty acid desaturase
VAPGGSLGGLNYQIEHHLFPSMPRASLRRGLPIVQAFCQAHHVTYRQTGLITSYAQALSHLNMVGRSPDTLPAT